MARKPTGPQPQSTAGAGTRRQPLLIADGAGWRVESGAVDLFATRLADGQPAGERRHLLRIPTGGVLLGAGLERARDLVGLLAVPLQGSRLEALGVGDAAIAPEAVDGWVQALSSTVAAPLPSRLDHLLAPGSELELVDRATAHAGRAVVWVRQREGEPCMLGGLPSLRTSADRFVPVTSDAWLQALGAGRIEVVDSRHLLALDPERLNLGAFQRACLPRFAEQLAADAEHAEQRLHRRLAADADAVRSALGDLAEVLHPTDDDEVATAGKNALLRACELVGAPLGITIRPPLRLGDRTDREALTEITRASRVRTRRVMLRGDWWQQDNGPLLGWDKDGRPLALVQTGRLRYEAVDPATGARRPLSAAVAESLEPWADSLYTPFPARALGALDLMAIGLSNCRRRDLLRILLAGLGAGLLGMAPAIATGIVFDRAVPAGDRGVLAQIALALLVTVVASTLLQLTRSLSVLRVEARTAGAVQAGVWDRLMGLPVSFFRGYLSGDLAIRSLGIDAIRQALTGATLSSLLGGIFSVFTFALLFYYDHWLALVATGLVTVASLVVIGLSYLELRYHRELQRISGEVSALVLQLLGGIAKLRVAAAEERGFAVFSRRFGEQQQLSIRAGTIGNWLSVFNTVFPTLATMVVFAVVAPRPGSATGLSTASFLAFYAAFGQFLATGVGLSWALIRVLEVVPFYERAKPILEATPEVDLDKAPPGELEGRIELSHVSFRYRAGGPLVLDDVSLQARPGELVAIVGPSGAGKSTVMRLLLGFELPESGSVYIDGKVLSSLDVQAVRRQMGVVLQHGQLLPGSLHQNIVGATSLTVDDAWAAARLAGLAADIEAMPMGMHTYVPEGGSTLSGGQRQRLLIARAVVSRPRILLFDEATSALDNLTQAQVTASLEGLRATRIVIAHRLSTIARADRIYLVKGGRIAQSGTYAELIAKPGPFAELARRQLA